MKGKGILLLIALVLPSCVFVFLKFFGKNEFAVEPLFQERPLGGIPAECGEITFPYHLPDSVIRNIHEGTGKDSIALVYVPGYLNVEGKKQINRITESFGYPSFIRGLLIDQTRWEERYRKCVFLLPDSYNAIVADKKGTIRGQYNINDREDVDRLLTELTIIFKKY